MRQRSDGWGEVANSLCDAGSVGEQKKNSLSSTTVDCPPVSGMRVSFSSFLKIFFYGNSSRDPKESSFLWRKEQHAWYCGCKYRKAVSPSTTSSELRIVEDMTCKQTYKQTGLDDSGLRIDEEERRSQNTDVQP